jgi:hypothetical protein
MKLSIEPNTTQAILIGASEFDDEELLPLPAVKNNISELERLLAEPKVIGIPRENTTSIVNALSGDDISRKINDIVTKALDTLIIYYAGHGVMGLHQKLYLATKNTHRSKPEFSGALPFSKIRDIVRQEAKAKKIIIILDCCFSGLAIEEFRPKGRKQVYIITATHSTEDAVAPQGAIYTAFTNELVSLLDKGIDNGKNTLTLGEIYGYLKNKLVSQKFPEPQSASVKEAEQLVIASNRAYLTRVYVPNYQHDIFVSYAYDDNKLLPGMDNGWITTLIDALKKLLGQKLAGENAYSLFMDKELRGNTVVPEIAKQVENSATLLVILSPCYLDSPRCLEELNLFLAKKSKDIECVFIIERSSVQCPEKLCELPSYKFWRRDETGNPRTLATPKPNPDTEPEYYQAVDDMTYQLANKLKELKQPAYQTSNVLKTANGLPTLFLAEVTDDLEEQRNELKRSLKLELEELGWWLLPDKKYSATNPKFLDQDLSQCDLFVQLLSDNAGNGYPQFQYERAKATGLSILQWRNRELDLQSVSNPIHRHFLQVRTVIATELVDFKKYIIKELQPKKEKSQTTVTENTWVFINTASEDWELAIEIQKILEKEGFEYSLPAAQNKSAEIRQDLEKNLLYCDAVIVPYYKTPQLGVREHLMHCRRMQAKREQPFKMIAICDKPYPDKPSSLFMKFSNMKILACPTLQAETALPYFIHLLKTLKT